MSSVNKRLLKELRLLTIQQRKKPLHENDYIISFDESDLTKVYAIIKCPYDSLYRHKFIRLNFDIPNNYPFSPPKVYFVNYDGSKVHPTLYSCGRVCCTILNTWPSIESESKNKLEAWTSSFGIESVILTIFSFLDNEPYTHEASAPNNDSYNTYVLFQGWYTCLIRYLENKNEQPELFTTFISNYLLLNINNIMEDLRDLNDTYPPDAYETNCFYIGYYMINYIQVINKLGEWYNFIDYKEHIESEQHDLSFNDFSNINHSCNICFDTNENQHDIISLSCGGKTPHNFHIGCIKLHVNNNGNICSLCRTDINKEDLEKINKNNVNDVEDVENSWIINPETKRKVKIGSKTYKRLKLENII
jgi:ubiquitin-protein ligase